jgi:uncharacterized protein DUF4238
MEYKVVRRPHVVPRGYLWGFAVGELIAMRLIGDSPDRQVPVSKAGVLKDYYVRQRPADGSPSYDVDWSLDHIDKVAPPILREIAERWPLNVQDKVALAEFIAMQLLRGPRWRSWHASFTDDYLRSAEARRLVEGREPPGLTTDEALAGAQIVLTSSTAVLTKMIEMSRKVAQIVGSMHWTLIEFARPWLATSDHPVITWPLGVGSRSPRKSENFVEAGLVKTLEARFPVSSQHALLMTWSDGPDDYAPILVGSKEAAANINAFTVAEAEHQWFHKPGCPAPRGTGKLLPLGPRLLDEYTAMSALTSHRRNLAHRRIQPKLGDRSLTGAFEILRVEPGREITIVPVAPLPVGGGPSYAA